MKIRVTPTALNDLKEIKYYIENDLSNPIAANNVIKRIIDDYSRLEISPHMGRHYQPRCLLIQITALSSAEIILYSTKLMTNMFLYIECFTGEEITLKSFLMT